MKKYLSFILAIFFSFILVACGNNGKTRAIELMGAGDRIHDSYTFANAGVQIKESSKNNYVIYGSVEKLTDEDVKKEFKIDSDITHVVAVKLTAIEKDVDANKVEISVNGSRAYDAEHLNGSNYTFIILEANKGQTVSISVKWNENDIENTYVVNFSEDIELK